jgi:hypothetical protein
MILLLIACSFHRMRLYYTTKLMENNLTKVQSQLGRLIMTLKRSSFHYSRLDIMKSVHRRNQSFPPKLYSPYPLLGKKLLLELRLELMTKDNTGDNSSHCSSNF